MIRVGLIGAGHWGPNIARCFELSGNVELRWLCDLDSSRLEGIAARYPRANSARDLQTVLDDDDVEAVAISTPAATHYEITRKVGGIPVKFRDDADVDISRAKTLSNLAEAGLTMIETTVDGETKIGLPAEISHIRFEWRG